MTDHPELPATPDAAPKQTDVNVGLEAAAPDDATVTSPAGAQPPVPMRTPKHGHGRIYTRGVKGNVGGGRHPQKVLDQLIEICGLAADEMLLRLQDVEVRAQLTTDELRLILKEAGAFVLPKQVQLSGPAGGPIPIENVGEQLRQRLSERLDRLRVLRSPAPEAATPPPETPLGVASAPL